MIKKVYFYFELPYVILKIQINYFIDEFFIFKL